MLILPPGHAEAVRAHRAFSTREKWMVGGVLALAAALLLAVVISFTAGGHASRNGCVDINIPYSTGGQELYRCGDAARTLCTSVGTANGPSGAVASAITRECRKAGIAVGP